MEAPTTQAPMTDEDQLRQAICLVAQDQPINQSVLDRILRRVGKDTRYFYDRVDVAKERLEKSSYRERADELEPEVETMKSRLSEADARIEKKKAELAAQLERETAADQQLCQQLRTELRNTTAEIKYMRDEVEKTFIADGFGDAEEIRRSIQPQVAALEGEANHIGSFVSRAEEELMLKHRTARNDVSEDPLQAANLVEIHNQDRWELEQHVQPSRQKILDIGAQIGSLGNRVQQRIDATRTRWEMFNLNLTRG